MKYAEPFKNGWVRAEHEREPANTVMVEVEDGPQYARSRQHAAD